MVKRKSQWRKNVDWIEWQAAESQDGKFDPKKTKRKLAADQLKAMLRKKVK